MTVMADLNAVSLTATAKAACEAKGLDIVAMVGSAKLHVVELQRVLTTIVSFHPTMTGPDIANVAALTAVIAQLA
jgi:hypothetical protein